MIPEALEKIAEHVLSLDDADLGLLLEHYKDRISQQEPNRAWERAVIAYFLINGIRVKNTLKHNKLQNQVLTAGNSPRLHLVKA